MAPIFIHNKKHHLHPYNSDLYKHTLYRTTDTELSGLRKHWLSHYSSFRTCNLIYEVGFYLAYPMSNQTKGSNSANHHNHHLSPQNRGVDKKKVNLNIDIDLSGVYKHWFGSLFGTCTVDLWGWVYLAYLPFVQNNASNFIYLLKHHLYPQHRGVKLYFSNWF